MSRTMMMLALVSIAIACSDDPSTGPGGGDPNAIASVRFSPSVGHVTAWDSIPMTVVVTDAGGRPVTDRPITWSSEHQNVATVSTRGYVTGVAQGQATIAATVDGKRATATVHVSWPPVAELTLDAEAVALGEGTTRQLVGTPRDAQGRAIPGLFVGFSSSDPGIAHVDALGTVTAIRPGTARITATSHGRTAEATVSVTADHPYDLMYQQFADGDVTVWQLDIRQPSGEPVRIFPGRLAANPVPSPDGSRIAFVTGGPTPSLWIAKPDGSDARELAAGSAMLPVYQPTWSPDGTKLAYTRRVEGEGERIEIIDVATGAVLLTTQDHPGAQNWPSWSRVPVDGSHRIAYAQFEGGRQEIWTMKDDGTDRRQITSGEVFDGQPAWSPDAQTIAFTRLSVSGADIWLVNADGTNARGLAGLYLAGAQSAPAWSPDGTMIAFASRHETYGQNESIHQIYTVRLNGSGLARRTSGAGDKLLPVWVQRVE